MLKQVMMEFNYDNATLILAKAVKIVRIKIIGYKSSTFDGNFLIGCHQASVPSSLKTFVSLLLNGTDLKDQDTTDSQASFTISQMILFNFHSCTSSTAKSRHYDRVLPLPLYVGMKIHTETRSKKIVTQL